MPPETRLSRGAAGDAQRGASDARAVHSCHPGGAPWGGHPAARKASFIFKTEVGGGAYPGSGGFWDRL